MVVIASIIIVVWFLTFLSSDIIMARPVKNSTLGSLEKQHGERPCDTNYDRTYMRCQVPVLDNINLSVYSWELIELEIWCDTVMPSRLLDGFFEPLGHSLEYIRIYDCNIVNISRNAFRGMKELLGLWIKGNSNSNMNGCGVQLINASTMKKPPQHELAFRPSTVMCNHDSLVLPENVFSELESLSSLELEMIRLNNSVWRELQNLSNLKSLFLTNNDITSIEISAISKLKRLNILQLNGNYIQRILNGTFESLIRLWFVDLSRNRISFLERDAFKSLSKVTTLGLSTNHIRNVEIDIFKGFIELKRLSLSGNQIKTMCKQAFSQLTSLLELDMSYNFIEMLPIFPISLTSLDLNNNKIVDIYNNSFEGLSDLSKVNLGSNSLVYLPEDVFMTNNKLLLLDLSFNQIVKLPILPDSLTVLDLRNNCIEYLSNNSFAGVSNLSNLNLGSNGLVHLPEDVFRTNFYIQLLDLSFNEIVQIPSLPFSLETLNVTNNNVINVRNIPFVSINYLSVLDLSHNKVRECSFYFPHSMREFNLSSNNLSDVSFNLAPKLRYADLRNNQLVSLTITPIKQPLQTNDISLGHIFLAEYGNSFRCECNLEWEKGSFSYDDRYAIQYRIWELTSLNCSPVYEDEPGVLTEIDLANFDCRYTVSCPDNCTCYHWRYKNNINIVVCQDAGLTYIPANISATCSFLDLSGNMFQSVMPGIFQGLSQLVELYLNSSTVSEIQAGTFEELPSLARLDLSNNSLVHLRSEIFAGLYSLVFLNLSLNRINFIRESTFEPMEKLKNLDLSENKLEVLSNSDIVRMSTLMSLRLSNNPWSCDCTFLENFMVFASKSSVQDRSDIICFTSNKSELHITYIFMKEFCPYKPDISDGADITAITVSTAIGVLAITIIIGILWFKNRKLLKLCCFVHFGWKFGSTPNDEQDKPYDAFVSFSSWDDLFIARELMPRLEGPLPGKQGYTLCVHFRDFPVGASIAESILHAVENSRRVIMIISDNFLRSEWCHFEFQAAHRQLLREKKSRIITVLLHDINTDLLDEYLSMFLSTRTYVKYGDPLLWNKIEYAMPKRKPATDDNLNADNHEEQVNNLAEAFDDNANDDIQLID